MPDGGRIRLWSTTREEGSGDAAGKRVWVLVGVVLGSRRPETADEREDESRRNVRLMCPPHHQPQHGGLLTGLSWRRCRCWAEALLLLDGDRRIRLWSTTRRDVVGKVMVSLACANEMFAGFCEAGLPLSSDVDNGRPADVDLFR